MWVRVNKQSQCDYIYTTIVNICEHTQVYISTNNGNTLQLHHHPLVLHAQVVMSVLWEIVKRN